MRFRFPEFDVLEAAVEQWYISMKPDVRRDHLSIEVLHDTAFDIPGAMTRRHVVLAINDLNEPEAMAGLLHCYLARLVGETQDDGMPLPDSWELIALSYEYDDKASRIKIAR